MNIEIKKLAHALQCAKQMKNGYEIPHREYVDELAKLLPSGSGIDSGMKIIECNPARGSATFLTTKK